MKIQLQNSIGTQLEHHIGEEEGRKKEHLQHLLFFSCETTFCNYLKVILPKSYLDR